MKQLAVALTLVAALISTQGSQPPVVFSETGSSAAERLINGGFESGLNGWSFPPWFTGVIGIEEKEVHGGAKALRFKGKGSWYYLQQDVPALPGDRVNLSGWINVPQRNGNVMLTVELVARHQNNGDLQTYVATTIANTTNGWLPLSGTAVMPARTAVVRVQIRVPKLNGSAYLDDLSVTVDPNGVASATPTAILSTLTPTATPTPTVAASPATPPATTTPSATATPSRTVRSPVPTPTEPTATPTVSPPMGSVLADTSWPTYGQNERRNNRSPYAGPQTQPTRKWTFSRTSDHWGTDYRGVDMGENGTLYLAAGMTGVYAIDSATGQMKWLFSPENTGHETWVEFPPTVSYDGKLYFTSENDYIYAMSADGKVLWKYRTYHLHTPVSISPDGSTVHFISEDGSIYALDRSTGSLKWKRRLGNGLYGTGRRIPVVYDPAGNLYFCWISTAWSLTPSGEKRWSLDVPSRGSYMAGPAVGDNGILHFVYSDTVYAVGMDGRLKWQYTMGKTAFDRTPAIGPVGTIYVGAEDGFIHALDPNGSLKWKEQYVTATGWGGGIKSNLLLDSKGTLYFLGKDQYVYAVSSATRQLLWKHPTGYEDNSYPGIQLCLDTSGTLYVPVDERVLIALYESGNTIPSPTATATTTPTPTRGTTPTPSATPLISTSGPTPTATPAIAASPTTTATPTLAPSRSILYGAWVGKTVNIAGDEAAFEDAVGKPRAIRHWYWSVAPLSTSAANFAAWSASTPEGAILMLSWAPSPMDSTLDAAAGGIHDDYIAEWARTLKAHGRELLLRMMWEDNGPWFWWYSGGQSDSEAKEKYKTVFRRVVKIFRREGADNVRFVWSPHVRGYIVAPAVLSYPGSEYVDWIGLDGYPLRGSAGDFYSNFKSDYDDLSTLAKPMMIAETGISLSDDIKRAAYVTNLLTYELPYRFPRFEAFVWFNEPPFGDLLDPAHPLTLEAFRRGIASSYYRGR